MRKLAVLAALLCGLGALPASADGFSVAGAIQFPGPGGRVRAGVTEMTSPCGGGTANVQTNGFDGFWFALPGAGEAIATMTSSAIDANVYFYDAECELIGATTDPVAHSMATDGTPDEHGIVPAEARYGIVDVIVGWNVAFQFTID